jgi:hypothetical protein
VNHQAQRPFLRTTSIALFDARLFLEVADANLGFPGGHDLGLVRPASLLKPFQFIKLLLRGVFHHGLLWQGNGVENAAFPANASAFGSARSNLAICWARPAAPPSAVTLQPRSNPNGTTFAA